MTKRALLYSGKWPTVSFGDDTTPATELIAYATREPVVIVHRAEDLEDDDNQDDEESESGDDSANDENPNQNEDAENPQPTGAAVRVGGGFGGSIGAAVAMIAFAVVGASMVLFA